MAEPTPKRTPKPTPIFDALRSSVLEQMKKPNPVTMDDTGIISFVGIGPKGERMPIDGKGNYPYGLILLEFVLGSILGSAHPAAVNLTDSMKALLRVISAECWQDAEEEQRELFTILKQSVRLESITWRNAEPDPIVP